MTDYIPTPESIENGKRIAALAARGEGVTATDLYWHQVAEEQADLIRALTDGQHRAAEAADKWETIAHKLTHLRAFGAHLPEIPDDLGENKPITLPFDRDEMRRELDALSGLITKAYTIAALYREDVGALADTIDSIKNPDTDQ